MGSPVPPQGKVRHPAVQVLCTAEVVPNPRPGGEGEEPSISRHAVNVRVYENPSATIDGAHVLGLARVVGLESANCSDDAVVRPPRNARHSLRRLFSCTGECTTSRLEALDRQLKNGMLRRTATAHDMPRNVDNAQGCEAVGPAGKSIV